MKKYLLIVYAFSFLSSCMRLDDNLYNLSEKITEYKRDLYAGEQDFVLDASYYIHDSLIHEFTLSSQAPDENSSTLIYATYIGSLSKIATDTVIMYCHGNKWHMDFYWQRAKLLAHTGGKNRFGVLMIDYRGFGLSQGKPTENGMYADVDAALVWLKSKGLSDGRLVMYGFSLGSAPVAELTAQPRSMSPSKIILEAPFASAEVFVNDGAVIAIPSSYFTNLKIDNANEITKVQQPFMWIHGTNDQFINIETHGELVYSKYQGTYKEAHRIGGADHDEVPATMGFVDYCNSISNFIIR